MANDPRPENVNANVRIQKSDMWRMIATTGVWGGPTPQGMIAASMFNDMVAIEDEIVIGPNGQPVLTGTEKAQVDRQLECTLLIHPAIARSIGRWLIDTADSLEQQLKSEQ